MIGPLLLLLLLAALAPQAPASPVQLQVLLDEWTVDGQRPIAPSADAFPGAQAARYCAAGLAAVPLSSFEACVAEATEALIAARHLNVVVEQVAHEARLVEHGVDLGDVIGHTGICFNKTRAIVAAAARPEVRTYCEIGFNAGHSAVNVLVSNPDARVVSFDIGLSYTSEAVQCVHERFGARLELVLGDSSVTVPAYARNHPEFKCDVLLVDGGHGEAQAITDLRNMRALAADAHVLLLDDPDLPEVERAVRQVAGLRWTEEVTSRACKSLSIPQRGQNWGPQEASCWGKPSNIWVGEYLPPP